MNRGTMKFTVIALALLTSSCAMMNRTNNMVARWEHDVDSQHQVRFELRIDNAAWIPITPEHKGDQFEQRLFLPKGWKAIAIRACDTSGACMGPAVVKVTRK